MSVGNHSLRDAAPGAVAFSYGDVQSGRIGGAVASDGDLVHEHTLPRLDANAIQPGWNSMAPVM